MCNAWMSIVSVNHFDAKAHFMQFCLPFLSEFGNRDWGCVWITIIGELCKYRNKCIFKNGMVDIYGDTTKGMVMD